MNLLTQLSKEKLLPLYTVTDLSLLPIVKDVLLSNNLHFMEVTYRSEFASQAIAQLAKSNHLIVGAGTVCDVKTAKDAIDNGAKFIVMPGIYPDVVTYCQNEGIPVFPGAVTPSEIVTAINLGLSVVKFFPANIYGGLSAIKNLCGPFPNMLFIPTGGIDTSNYVDYTTHPNILAVGGSFIISEKMIAEDEGVSAKLHLANLISQL